MGPPNNPACCPVVTTMPPRATRANRLAAGPLASKAGASAPAQSPAPWSRTAVARARHSEASRGAASYHADSGPPARAAFTTSGIAIASDTTLSSLTRRLAAGVRARAPPSNIDGADHDAPALRRERKASLVVRFAAPDRAGAIELFREHQARDVVRQRPPREGQHERRPTAHVVRQAVRAADHERHVASALAMPAQPVGELRGSHQSSLGVAGHEDARRSGGIEQALALALAHLV